MTYNLQHLQSSQEMIKIQLLETYIYDSCRNPELCDSHLRTSSENFRKWVQLSPDKESQWGEGGAVLT